MSSYAKFKVADKVSPEVVRTLVENSDKPLVMFEAWGGEYDVYLFGFDDLHEFTWQVPYIQSTMGWTMDVAVDTMSTAEEDRAKETNLYYDHIKQAHKIVTRMSRRDKNSERRTK